MPAPMIITLPGGTPGHAREQDPPAAVGLAQVVGALLDREPARHLAHRREEREAPVGALHRLVRDRDRARLLEGARELGHGREMEVGEQDLRRPGAAGTRTGSAP